MATNNPSEEDRRHFGLIENKMNEFISKRVDEMFYAFRQSISSIHHDQQAYVNARIASLDASIETDLTEAKYLTDIVRHYNQVELIWDSTFLESGISRAKRHQWYQDAVINNVNDINEWDEAYPFFTHIVDIVSTLRFRDKLLSYADDIAPSQIQIEKTMKKKKREIGNSLNCTLSNQQLSQLYKLMSDCLDISEVSETSFYDFFKGDLSNIHIKSRNNRKLSFILEILKQKGCINNNYVSIIEKTRCILSPKTNETLNRNDIDAAKSKAQESENQNGSLYQKLRKSVYSIIVNHDQ